MVQNIHTLFSQGFARILNRCHFNLDPEPLLRNPDLISSYFLVDDLDYNKSISALSETLFSEKRIN